MSYDHELCRGLSQGVESDRGDRPDQEKIADTVGLKTLSTQEATPPEAARLAWQCRRGMRELDLLLQGFLDQQYEGLNDLDKARFVALLAYPDQLLFEYLMGRMSPSDPEMGRMVAMIRKGYPDSGCR